MDRFSHGRTGFPDNKFDYIPGLTIDTEEGWIIFPTLKPFLNNLAEYNFFPEVIDSSYWYPEIYEQLKVQAQQVNNANLYTMDGYAVSH
ncbi:MAG: hypothetical protein ABI462_03510 [Ignavibacteria bacterium]